MPFLGRDFRAPGQNWVRAHKGWEILIALREKLNTHIRSLSKDRYAYLNEMPVSEQLPDKNSNMNNNNNNMEMHGDRNGCNRSLYIVIPKGRKDAGFMAGTVNIAEIMTRLDFGGVARDPRRFNYICKVLSLIVTEKFNEVSGTSQKHVMNVIGQIVNIVCESTQNIRECQCLLKLIEKAMKDGRHTHVGSTKVWQKKLDTVHVWQEMLNNIELYEREDDEEMVLMDLPDDCLRQILLRFSDHRDVVNLGATNDSLNQLCKEEEVWRELCNFHFSEKQIWSALPDYVDEADWHLIYLRLLKKHGKRETYAEMPLLCNRCHSLYWKVGGHPCTSSETDEEEEHLKGSKEISPQEFMKLIF